MNFIACVRGAAVLVIPLLCELAGCAGHRACALRERVQCVLVDPVDLVSLAVITCDRSFGAAHSATCGDRRSRPRAPAASRQAHPSPLENAAPLAATPPTCSRLERGFTICGTSMHRP